MIEEKLKYLKENGFVNEDNEDKIREALMEAAAEGYQLGLEDGEPQSSHFVAYGKKEDYC